ncbi:MAG: tetratricopeptide repeat protein [Pseudomonadota bacterium]
MKKFRRLGLLILGLGLALPFFYGTPAAAQKQGVEGEVEISKPTLPSPAPEAGPEATAEPGAEIPAWKARWELARLLAYDKNYTESLAQYEKLLTEKPDLDEARAEMAKVLFWAGRRDEALKVLEGLGREGGDPEIQLLKADLLTTQKRYAEAEKLYRNYLEAKSTDWAARFKLAQVLSWSKKYDQALKEYEAILKARPNDVQVRRNYALVLSWAGQHGRAAAELKKTLGD